MNYTHGSREYQAATLAQARERVTVRLTRKLAERIDGIDLANVDVGDLLELPQDEARMLTAEGWADVVVTRTVTHHEPAVAADRSRRTKTD